MAPPLEDNSIPRTGERQFQCARCGRCCKGDGIVRVDPDEAAPMARALGLSPSRFLKDFALQVQPRSWILQDRMNPTANAGGEGEKWCVMLKRCPDGLYGCRLQEVKPRQCRNFGDLPRYNQTGICSGKCFSIAKCCDF